MNFNNDDNFDFFQFSAENEQKKKEPVYKTQQVPPSPYGNGNSFHVSPPPSTVTQVVVKKQPKVLIIILSIITILSCIATFSVMYYYQNIKKPIMLPNNDITNVGAAVWNNTSSSVVQVKTDSGAGSGVVINQDGYILTNHHVIELSENSNQISKNIYVKFTYSDVLYSAKYVNSDPKKDIAVIKLSIPSMPVISPVVAAQFAKIDNLNYGDTVFAIGNPLDMAIVITDGIVAHPNFNFPTSNYSNSYKNCVWHTAQINPGNSGGPLVNINGKILGINSFSQETHNGQLIEHQNYAISNREILPLLNGWGIDYII